MRPDGREKEQEMAAKEAAKTATARKATRKTKQELVAHVDDKSFLKVVGKAKRPVLVDLSADWCGPCRSLGKVLPAIAEKYADRVTVVKVDIDESPRAAELCQVEAVPMLVLFQAGRAVAVETGFASRRDTVDWLEKALRAAERSLGAHPKAHREPARSGAKSRRPAPTRAQR